MGKGLQRIAKVYGGIVINGEKFVWDYAADEAVPENEMSRGSKRWRASEEARRRIMIDIKLTGTT